MLFESCDQVLFQLGIGDIKCGCKGGQVNELLMEFLIKLRGNTDADIMYPKTPHMLVK